MALILITGPSRSGKSEWAEDLAQRTGQPIIYIATAIHNLEDLEWEARITQHQKRRPESWKVLELNQELIAFLQKEQDSTCCLLIDSLGTWLATWLEESEEVWQPITSGSSAFFPCTPSPFVKFVKHSIKSFNNAWASAKRI